MNSKHGPLGLNDMAEGRSMTRPACLVGELCKPSLGMCWRLSTQVKRRYARWLGHAFRLILRFLMRILPARTHMCAACKVKWALNPQEYPKCRVGCSWPMRNSPVRHEHTRVLRTWDPMPPARLEPAKPGSSSLSAAQDYGLPKGIPGCQSAM